MLPQADGSVKSIRELRENGKFSLRIWSAFDHCITPVIFHAMPDLLAIIAQWQEGWGENVHNSTQHLFQSFD